MILGFDTLDLLSVGGFFAIVGGVVVYSYVCLRSATTRRWLRVLPAAVLMMAAPFLVPLELTLLRFIAAFLALATTARLFDLAWQRAPDLRMLATPSRFVMWAAILTDTTWTEEPEDKRRNRADGARRFSRGLAKSGLFLGLLAMSTAWPELHTEASWTPLSWLWTAWTFYLLFSLGTDFIQGAYMLALGLHTDALFDRPFLARSPRDFWSRRWNLWFRVWSHRNIFAQLKGKMHSGAAVMVVFFMSAAIHEYLMIVSLGGTGGHMAAFFLLHGVVTVATTALLGPRLRRWRMPAPVAVGLHTVWLVGTSSLFFVPLLQIFPLTAWRLW